MIEECRFCSALFSVSETGGGGVCGACNEPICCPHCHKTVRQERTTGVFTETLVRAPYSPLAQHLTISDDELSSMSIELIANTGSSGDAVYSYWFEVPDDTPKELLEKNDWKVGQTIDDIPVWVVDGDCS
ncbi:hypothetical protein L1D14_03830 [Vibrio tubiashii]|uniref:hypothetical protein n=1 Tax=Vibrio tubiashii TaxID=29498 RepID=UPI001EFDCCAC|nr:hypothetical protein [Vibrio tubiashii]MCG9575360.1 hypothetical protein [Vibrio tubiashii]